MVIYATAASAYQTGVIKSALTPSRRSKIRRHMQPYVCLALRGAWDLEFREAQRMRPAI
jgi:hypothetical protein